MRAPGFLRRFARDDSGSITVWALNLFLVTALLGAAALDVTNLFAIRSQLQVVADAAAHAALLRRNQGAAASAARTDAIAVARFAMPAAFHGEVVEPADIRFGRYDAATDTFTVDDTSREAVLVVAGREAASDNPVATWLFRLAGYDSMDVAASALAVAGQAGGCARGGLLAQGVVDIRSQSDFRDGFCIHSNAHVEFNNGNTFEADDGVVVSMPDIADLVIPASGMRQNPGLEQALRPGRAELRVLDLIRPTGTTPLETALLTPGNRLRPSYITSTTVQTITPSSSLKLTPSSFTAGRVHRATCSGNQSLTFDPGNKPSTTVYSRFVLITNCEIQFSGRVDLQDAIVYTTATGSKSIKANTGGGSGLWIGKEDACATGGGAQVITRGSLDSSAKLTLNGGQIIALGDVSFAAQAEGVGGTITAGGAISGTSRLDFAGCRTGMEGTITVLSYRLAR